MPRHSGHFVCSTTSSLRSRQTASGQDFRQMLFDQPARYGLGRLPAITRKAIAFVPGLGGVNFRSTVYSSLSSGNHVHYCSPLCVSGFRKFRHVNTGNVNMPCTFLVCRGTACAEEARQVRPTLTLHRALRAGACPACVRN